MQEGPIPSCVTCDVNYIANSQGHKACFNEPLTDAALSFMSAPEWQHPYCSCKHRPALCFVMQLQLETKLLNWLQTQLRHLLATSNRAL